MRVGTGFDVHAFTDGDHVWLGGVRIPAERGVVAHSDGDVVLHALTDAVLGALAEGDIGDAFPAERSAMARAPRPTAFSPSRPSACRRAGRAHRQPRRDGAVRERRGSARTGTPSARRIAAIAGVPLGAVSVKATTTEQLGFIGRGEGIAAQAVATLRLPPERA